MYCSMPKYTSQAKATLNREKINPITLAIIKLHLSEGISYLVSQLLSLSVENSAKQLFCSNFLKTFWVDLRACLALVPINQYCPIVLWEIKAGYG